MHARAGAVVHPRIERGHAQVLGLLQHVPALPWLAGGLALLQRHAEGSVPEDGAIEDGELDRLDRQGALPLLDVELGRELVVASPVEGVIGREVDALGGAYGGLDGEAALDFRRLGDGGEHLAGLGLDL